MGPLLDIFSHPVSAVILLLGLLVFFHEAGHFIVGKLSGIAVEVFSIGFGPVIAGFRFGETEYRLSLIPLGGFVKFAGAWPGEEVDEKFSGRSFHDAKLWKRALVIAAGPFANIVLAICCHSMLGWIGIEQPPPLVGEVIKGGRAEQAGLIHGDIIKTIDGEQVNTWKDLHDSIFDAPGKQLRFEVLRQGEVLPVLVTPKKIIDKLAGASYGRIGISPASLPPIITVESESSLAYQLGLRTGDRVVKVGAAEVLFWSDFEKGMKLGSEGSDGVEIYIKRISELSERRFTIPKAVFGELGIRDSQLTVDKVKDIADAQKVLFGDVLLSWNGQPISNIFQFGKLMSDNTSAVVDIGVLRNGKNLSLSLKLKPLDVQRTEGKVRIYVLPAELLGKLESPKPVVEKYDFVAAWSYGTKRTIKDVEWVARMIGRLFMGKVPLKALGGPISIAKVASDSVKMGWVAFFSVMALISINLALLNMVPIPILDGGQLLILFAEALRGKPLPVAAIENFQKIGFVMVLSLVALATYNDLSRFWSSMLEGVSQWFQ